MDRGPILLPRGPFTKPCTAHVRLGRGGSHRRSLQRQPQARAAASAPGSGRGTHAHEGLVGVEDLVRQVTVVAHLHQGVLLLEAVAGLRAAAAWLSSGGGRTRARDSSAAAAAPP